MINNRQGGRRRGRGGQRGPNPGGQPGNRQDNRQRGNAAQLLEKYKSMARDSQLAGDRVQTEYYLQFADHYFRVLGESQARFNEQRRQRGDDIDDEDGDDGEMDSADGDFDSTDDRPEQQDRNDRDDRPERNERNDRPDRTVRRDRPRRDEEEDRPAARAVRSQDEERPAPRPRRDREPRRNDRANGGETIAFDVLPPAIGAEPASDKPQLEEDSPRPRRRTARAARPTEGEDDIAPAA